MELQDIDLRDLIENETGEKFNKQGYIKCPFHTEKTPSLRVKFNPDTNKDFFKCFGCSECGDAIDFIIKYKNLNYTKAREYLGLSVEKSEREIDKEKILSRIEWDVKQEFKKDFKLIGLFQFENKKNEVVYYKAKFLKPDGEKTLSYYRIEENKVINNRGIEEIPYNLYNALNAIKNDDVLIIDEGEKDANTINSIFKNKGYVATSLKGCKELDVLKNNRMKIYVIGDTGQAGEQYKWSVYNEFKKYAREFKFINLPGLKSLGDNKDVTDWIEVGHNKKDLLDAFERSLDIKNKYELQQDTGGIYKIMFKEKADEVIETKKYITDFRLISATRIKFIDEEEEGIKLVFKSITGNTIERIGKASVFDDVKSFKNFLGTMDLVFSGRVEDLNRLKGWINKYFALENEEVYGGVKFIERNGESIFIENNGSITSKGVNENIKSDGRNNADVIKNEPITTEELKEVIKHIFKFAGPEKSISIIGTVINNLAVHQCQELKQKLHHLLIVGESGSGKSTILENVIAPILNYPKKDIKSIGLISNFALMKNLSDGNYPALFDEFKPSMMDRYKIGNISETLRNLYDRATISKGNKSLKTTDFNLYRPIILAGEESYPNQEKALIERSCIIYLSRRERTQKNTEAMEWLIKNEELLNKLGRSLIEIVLELDVDGYRRLRCNCNSKIKGLNNRILNTAINESCGIRILNLLLEKHGLKQLVDFDDYITQNIKVEVLEDTENVRSLVERMLILYNDMINDSRAIGWEDVVKSRGDGLFIKTSELINQIREHVIRVGADLVPLNCNDFKKQAKKAGYLVKASGKVIKVDGKSIKFDIYDKEMLQALKVDSIASPDYEEVGGEEAKIFPFKQVTQKI
ncbi:CHC2 zinc finger domain-containing protein [Clostridium sporogenes]|uniref:CHC2 zinc finger domain-containing protein n=1 Tax=Clostridium sporogenes TaxID=1509 RepID=UPI00024BB226|nr:CHC2 zinc finger domain-containing protein [Clostridium sporogenes]EHN14125.1 DNA primase related protein [Clostridium sporogenes PA 3679]MDU4596804.1 CHC2 zinc finger domain-containing protein [Clostridium sporogenes]NFQ34667.1 DNA primase [Clostridium sporogenes]NFQ60974.1 DNA primase [Clostridium sporogenes]NFU09014.1 DNA primase [Clostridium sporogenes]